MGNQCSPDCRRGTGVLPDPREDNDGSTWNFFSVVNVLKLFFLKGHVNPMTESNFTNKLYFSYIYVLISVFRYGVSNRSLYSRTAYEIYINSHLHVLLMGLMDRKSRQIPMTHENYLGSRAKIFPLRPVLPFDHHPHAWTMA